MTREEMEMLWARFLAGDPLSAEEQQSLVEALNGDPALRDALLHDAELDGLMDGLGMGERTGDGFSRTVSECLADEEDATRFLEKMRLGLRETNAAPLERPSRRPVRAGLRPGRSGSGPRAFLAALVAAGMILGIVLLFRMSSPGPASRVEPQEARRKKAEEDRARAGARLEEIERKREELSRPSTGLDLASEDKRKRELASLESERERIEREMRDAIDRARKALPEPPRSVPESPTVEKSGAPEPAPKSGSPTEALLVTAEQVNGEAYAVRGGQRKALRRGEGLSAGEGLEVRAGAQVTLAYLDKTKLEAGPETILREIRDTTGKWIFLESGTLTAQVTPQPGDRAMVIETPHAEARVLGTTLRIVVGPDPKDGTRLDVREGKVRLKNAAGKAVEVSTGHYAVAATGVELAAKRVSSLVSEAPPNSWVSVPNTRMRHVFPDPAKYAKLQGNNGPAAVVGSWSGGAFDTRRNRLVLWGGGSTNYFGNELYAFSVETLCWERLTDPSPTNPAEGRQTNPDGTPAGRSTYGGLAYLSHADRLFGFGGALSTRATVTERADIPWTFEFATKRWTAGSRSNHTPGYGSNCSYDPATKRVWWCEGNASDAGAYGLHSYDPATSRWTKHTSDAFYEYTSGVDTRRGLLVVVGNGNVFAYDIRSGNPTRQTWKTTGGESFIARTAVGLDYDPTADRIVGWAGGAVYALNPDTRAWAVYDAPSAPKPTRNGIYGRWRYAPGVDAFIVVTDSDENVHFYKPWDPKGRRAK